MPHGMPYVAQAIRRAVLLADSVPELQATIEELRKPMAGGVTE